MAVRGGVRDSDQVSTLDAAARAGSAVRYFVEKGVEAERFRAIGLAETRPVDSNETAEGRRANRRVEFLFVHPPPQRPAAAMFGEGGRERQTAEAPSSDPDSDGDNNDLADSQRAEEPQVTVESK